MPDDVGDVMASTDADHGYLVRVTPKNSLLSSGALSFVGVTVPLFGTLYLLGTPLGTWPVISFVLCGWIALSFAAMARYRRVFVGVTETEVVARGFMSRTIRRSRNSVALVVLAETYRWNAPDSVPQFLLLDAANRRVLRMRGTFYSEEAMRAVAGAMKQPLAAFPEPITAQEYFATYPTGAYWFENRAPLTGSLAAVTVVASVFVILGLMQLAGIPFLAS